MVTELTTSSLLKLNTTPKACEPPGHWVGSGAEQLGLIGQAITTQSLKNLLSGFSPDGKEKLVNNAGKDSRQKGYDFTFSAPKDVSVLWACLLYTSDAADE